MYTAIFQELGLSKNEAEIYEALLRYGEMSVGQIAIKSKVHRRNVYDAIRRLIEKGLAFEILQRSENCYQAVEPTKLVEILAEKERRIRSVLPELEQMHNTKHKEQSIFMYRGIEGWKNYMRDIIRTGEDFYCIGGMGAWMDERNQNFFPQFLKDAKKKNINYFHLFDHEVRESKHDIVKYVGNNFKFLPEGYSTPASVDLFGDRVNIVSSIKLGAMDEDFSFAVIVNQQVADAFRTWFKFMWDFCPEEKS